MGAGPLWQISRPLAIRAGFRASFRRYTNTETSGSFADDDFDIRLVDAFRVSYPVYAGFVWNLSSRWDLNGSFTYRRLGEKFQYTSQQYAYELKYYF